MTRTGTYAYRRTCRRNPPVIPLRGHTQTQARKLITLFSTELVEAYERGAPTCALDVADEGTHTLDEVGVTFGITRERVRQIEQRALGKIRQWPGVEDLFV